MTIKITGLDDNLGIQINATGEISGEEYVKAHMRHLFQHMDKLQNIKYTISDWTRVTRHGITEEEMKIVARFCVDTSRTIPETLVAVIVNNDENLQLANLFKELVSSTSWEVEIASSSEDAKNWIKKI